MNSGFSPKQFIALRSAVDLLSGCCSQDYINTVLSDYRHGGARQDIAKSLYSMIDELEKEHLS